MKNLTQKQSETLLKIRDFITSHQHAPTLKELSKLLELKSTSSAQRHVEALKKKGYLIGARNYSRGLSIATSALSQFKIPLVGNIACGQPLLAQEHIEAYIPYSGKGLHGKSEGYFFLRAIGDSMNNADINGKNINDGDFVLIKQQNTAEIGQRIVALIGNEATIKRFKKGNGHYILEPESKNPNNKPIYIFEDILIQGVVQDVIKGGE